MEKILILFVTLAVGVLAGPYKLQGQKRDRLQDTLDNACNHLPTTQKDQILALTMGAFGCIYDAVDHNVSPQDIIPANATVREAALIHVNELCSVRQRLRTCAQQLLEYLAPCTSEATQAQIGDMKIAIRTLFSIFCDDDMAQIRHFVDDGAVECMENKTIPLSQCMANMMDLVMNMPNDTKSFEAIEMCYKYDEMTTCALNLLTECPKASTKEFMENVFALFRSGTYCRVTVPVGGNEVNATV